MPKPKVIILNPRFIGLQKTQCKLLYSPSQTHRASWSTSGQKHLMIHQSLYVNVMNICFLVLKINCC